MDFGYGAPDLLAMVECGILGMCYFSTSYLADRVPELEIVDLPFLFGDSAHAYGALDGALGAHLTERIEAQTGYKNLGFWDNGFRHLSNSIRDVRTPEDCRGLAGSLTAQRDAREDLRTPGSRARAGGTQGRNRHDRIGRGERAGKSTLEHRDLRRHEPPKAHHDERPFLRGAQPCSSTGRASTPGPRKFKKRRARASARPSTTKEMPPRRGKLRFARASKKKASPSWT